MGRTQIPETEDAGAVIKHLLARNADLTLNLAITQTAYDEQCERTAAAQSRILELIADLARADERIVYMEKSEMTELKSTGVED